MVRQRYLYIITVISACFFRRDPPYRYHPTPLLVPVPAVMGAIQFLPHPMLFQMHVLNRQLPIASQVYL